MNRHDITANDLTRYRQAQIEAEPDSKPLAVLCVAIIFATVVSVLFWGA